MISQVPTLDDTDHGNGGKFLLLQPDHTPVDGDQLNLIHPEDGQLGVYSMGEMLQPFNAGYHLKINVIPTELAFVVNAGGPDEQLRVADSGSDFDMVVTEEE
jgi:hypothetical protein